MVQSPDVVLRDFVTDGVPASGKWQPPKAGMREILNYLFSLYSAAQAGGGLAYATKAAMDADLAHDANQIAWVMEDPTAANNGIYAKVGGTGSGSWTRLGDLPYSYIKASNAGAGTANSIVATTSIPIPAADGGALIALPIVADNTASPVTVSFNGGAALTVKTAGGADVSVGSLKPGVVAGYVSAAGTEFRLFSEGLSLPAPQAGRVLGWDPTGTFLINKEATGLGDMLADNNLSDLTDFDAARAVLNVKALNDDGGFTFDTTATTQDIDTAFGGVWKTAHQFRSSSPDAFAGARFTAALVREAAGSGANGPGNADYALHIESRKTDYLTSAVLGEVDGLSITVRQGVNGDSGAILINAHRVESDGYGSTGVEAALSLLEATTGTKLREFKAVLGGNIPGTDLRSGGFGFLTRPNADGFSYAHGIAILGYSSAADTGITTAIECSATMDAADSYFSVTGDLHPTGAGLVRAGPGSAAFPSHSFIGDIDTGFYSAGVNTIGVASGGVVCASFAAGMRIGTGLVDPGAGKLNVQSSIQIGGTKVVGERATGWGRASGTLTRTTFATSTITVSQLAERVAALIDDLHGSSGIGHGLIGA